MKRTPLKRGKGLRKVGKKKPDREIQIQKVYKFFADIWSSFPSSERKCMSCGKPLHKPIRSYYFDHLIEKSKRPDLAFEKDNIFLCCLTCHSLKTDGHPTDLHREAIEKAKEKFGIT